MPVRGGDSGTRIENLGAMTYDGTEDIEYVKNKMMAALKIPKEFLGYEEGITGKATLAAEDIRFARTIERLQRITISELTKIAIVHLYSQGYTDAKLVDFSLKLTNPSTIFEEERVRILSEKLSTARDMVDAKMFSKDWVYDKIFGLAEDEVNEIRSNFVDDAKEFFRLESIQNEGNDPADPTQNSADAEEDDGWGFGKLSDEEKQEKIHQREKDENKRKNDGKKYDHPDDKPMGRDRLGADERRNSGRDWGDSPLKLEADLQKLDSFLKNSKKSETKIAKLLTESEQNSEDDDSNFLGEDKLIEK
jgi:hypothetical protein